MLVLSAAVACHQLPPCWVVVLTMCHIIGMVLFTLLSVSHWALNTDDADVDVAADDPVVCVPGLTCLFAASRSCVLRVYMCVCVCACVLPCILCAVVVVVVFVAAVLRTGQSKPTALRRISWQAIPFSSSLSRLWPLASRS